MERASQKRDFTLDGIRAVAAFLVIVNHTNSRIFQSLTPASGSWWLSLLWYYISKVDVPLFVMVSGACLLGRVDPLQKHLRRLGRVAAVYIGMGLLYLIWYDIMYCDPLKINLAWGLGLFSRLLTTLPTDSFWYLLFYAGLLLMLPFLQRLDGTLSGRGRCWLMGLCFGLDGGLRLLFHYLPMPAVENWLQFPLYGGYLGLFFAGRHLVISREKHKKETVLPAALLVISLCLCMLLTHLEYRRVPAGEKYWFMDDRLHPALLVCCASVCVFMLLQQLFSHFASPKSLRLLQEMGGCAFGCYLIQDLVIALTSWSVYMRLCTPFPAMVAVLIWEALIYLLAMGCGWVWHHLPGVRRFI